MLKQEGQGDGGIFIDRETLETEEIQAKRGRRSKSAVPPDRPWSIFVRRAVTSVKVAQSKVINFRLDRFGAGGVDRFSQLLHQKFDEFRSRALQVLSESLGSD